MRLRQKLIAAAMPALAILAALLIVAVMIAGVGESPVKMRGTVLTSVSVKLLQSPTAPWAKIL